MPVFLRVVPVTLLIETCSDAPRRATFTPWKASCVDSFKMLLYSHVAGMSADLVMLEAAAQARIGVVLLDEHYLGKKWPMDELRIIMKQRTCLPVLLGLSYEQFEKEVEWQNKQPAFSPEDSAMLDVLRRISMVTAAVDRYKLLQHAAFAVVQLLVMKDCQRLRSSAPDLALLLRVQAAAHHIIKKGEFSALSKADAEEAQEWALRLRYQCEKLEMVRLSAQLTWLPRGIMSALLEEPLIKLEAGGISISMLPLGSGIFAVAECRQLRMPQSRSCRQSCQQHCSHHPATLAIGIRAATPARQTCCQMCSLRCPVLRRRACCSGAWLALARPPWPATLPTCHST